MLKLWSKVNFAFFSKEKNRELDSSKRPFMFANWANETAFPSIRQFSECRLFCPLKSIAQMLVFAFQRPESNHQPITQNRPANGGGKKLDGSFECSLSSFPLNHRSSIEKTNSILLEHTAYLQTAHFAQRALTHRLSGGFRFKA